MVLYTDLVNPNIEGNMLVTEGKTQVILDNLREVQYMEECSEYGDQGYRLTSGERIAFANWNNVSDNTQKYLELIGYELQWNDEWIINYETDKCYRCQPDSYSWTPYYHITEGGEIIGGDQNGPVAAFCIIGQVDGLIVNGFVESDRNAAAQSNIAGIIDRNG